MSDNEIRNQISIRENRIKEIEEEATKKIANAEQEIVNEYNPKIDETSAKLEKEKNKLQYVYDQEAKQLKLEVRSLKAEINLLNKEKKFYLRGKLKKIAQWKKDLIKPLLREIKKLTKELMVLEKAREKF